MENAIECIRLSHSYGTKEIYNDLNFTVAKGRIYGLLGKNGTGKTTTINILMGFLKPSKGHCLVLGEKSHNLSTAARSRIGLLLEGHLQYDFMTIRQIERFYSAFYPNWNKDIYYDLMKKLPVTENQKVSQMSCGQQSQVALGLLLAQQPDLLIMDDYSMGLDAGYRRLFLEILADFTRDRQKTVFVTSHIVQDLEELVDDILIINYGGWTYQNSLRSFMSSFHRYRTTAKAPVTKEPDAVLVNIETTGDSVNYYSFSEKDAVAQHLRSSGIQTDALEEIPMTLEDAFLGLTGKY